MPRILADGPPSARVVLVGEAPGIDEVRSGKPFTGSSGRFLNEALVSAGLRRSECYLTNVSKIRPDEHKPGSGNDFG